MSGGSWKVAYSDFMTAMMAFFLLMWIITQVPEEKVAQISGYFKEGGGYGNPNPTVIDTGPPITVEPGMQTSQNATDADVESYLASQLKKKAQLQNITLAATEAGILLRVTGGVLFDANDSGLSANGREILDAVSDLMLKFKVDLVVRGYTDTVEDGQPYYQSKWELSAVRSAMATQYLVEERHVPVDRVVSASYADRNPIKIGLRGQSVPENRRVEFFFHRPDVKLSGGT